LAELEAKIDWHLFSKHDVIVFAKYYWQNLGRHMHKLFNTISGQGSFKLQLSNQPPSKHGSPGYLFIQKLVGSSLWMNALLYANQKKNTHGPYPIFIH